MGCLCHKCTSNMCCKSTNCVDVTIDDIQDTISGTFVGIKTLFLINALYLFYLCQQWTKIILQRTLHFIDYTYIKHSAKEHTKLHISSYPFSLCDNFTLNIAIYIYIQYNCTFGLWWFYKSHFFFGQHFWIPKILRYVKQKI